MNGDRDYGVQDPKRPDENYNLNLYLKMVLTYDDKCPAIKWVQTRSETGCCEKSDFNCSRLLSQIPNQDKQEAGLWGGVGIAQW